MKNLLKSNWTKWMPLGNYQFGDNDYIVFAKKNTKTGMMRFKTKTVTTHFMCANNILPKGIINVGDQWIKINQL